MSSPMTLREAVEIVALGRLKYGEKVYWDAPKYTTPSGRKEAEARGFAVWDRARAIVDAAVEFVEAEEAHSRTLQASWRGKASGNSVADTWSVKNQSIDKLRALERGEGSEVQP